MSLGHQYGYFSDDDPASLLVNYLKSDNWLLLRQWIAKSDRVTLVDFLNDCAVTFFRRNRKECQERLLASVDWDAILQGAAGLSARDRILLTYVYIDKLYGDLLFSAVVNDVRLRLETPDSITVSVVRAILNLEKHCHPEHRALIQKLVRLRQRGGRRRRQLK